MVSGRLRADEQSSTAKNKQIGFGGGRGGVVADMTVSYFSSGGKKQLLVLNADAKDAGKPPAGKQAAARNAAIATVLTAEKAAPESSVKNGIFRPIWVERPGRERSGI